jgi:branched-chain amino acid transport system substrate-binding protein
MSVRIATRFVLLVLPLLLSLAVQVNAQDDIVCERDVIVQADDWLIKLADKFYGNGRAYPAIFEATNLKARIDNTYPTISNANIIRVGWKLCVVDVPAAEEFLGFTLNDLPTGDQTPQNLDGVIKIGAAHALTGPLSIQGKSIRNGIDLAVQEVNQSGYLGSGQLEVVWEDTEGNTVQAVEAFESLISENVVAILGPTLSHSALAVTPIAQKAGIPVIGSSNVVDGVTDIGDYVFQVNLSESAILAATVAKTSADLNLEKVVIIYDTINPFTRNSLSGLERALVKAGVDILDTIPFETGDLSSLEQLGNLESLNPDAVLLVALAEDGARIITQTRKAGLSNTVPFIGGSSLVTPLFFETGGEAVEGTYTGAAWNADNSSGSNRKFFADYQQTYGRAPDQLAAQAYAATWALATAIRQADIAEPVAIRDQLDLVEFVETPLGLFSFDEKRNATHDPVLQIARDGTFVAVP